VPKISQQDWKKLYSVVRDLKVMLKTTTGKAELNKMFAMLYDTLNTIPQMSRQNWAAGWDEADGFERLAINPQATQYSVYDQFVNEYAGIVDQLSTSEYVAANSIAANPMPASVTDTTMFRTMVSAAYSVIDGSIEAMPAMIVFRKAAKIRAELAKAILPAAVADLIKFANEFADSSLDARTSGIVTLRETEISASALSVSDALLSASKDSVFSSRLTDETGRYADSQIAYYNALRKMAEVERRAGNTGKEDELDAAAKLVSARINKYLNEQFIEIASERTTDLGKLILLISYDSAPKIKRTLMDKIYNALISSNDPSILADVTKIMLKDDKRLEDIQKYIRSVSADSIVMGNNPKTIASAFRTMVDQFTDRTVINKNVDKAVMNELSVAAFGRAG